MDSVVLEYQKGEVRMLPFVTLRYREGRRLEELSENLTREFPNLIKPTFGLPEEDVFDVVCVEGQEEEMDVQDLEITIYLHDFGGNKTDLERHKEAILKEVRTYLANYDRNICGVVFLTNFPTTIHGEL